MINLNPFKKIINSNSRTGTKIVIINFIIVLIIIIFMTIGLPLLSIKFKIIVEIIDKLHIDRIIIALLGQGSLITMANSIRIAIENKNKQQYLGEKYENKKL